MGSSGKKRRPKRQQVVTAAAQAKERDQDTIRLINQALGEEQEERTQLRKLAAVRGLVNSELRSRLWPRLAGADPGRAASADSATSYLSAAAGRHRDSSTVACDVERSLWGLGSHLSEAQRGAARQQLARLLNALVVRHAGAGPEAVHYYQGLHDVASVLLLVAGERVAFEVLSALATRQLRDATRPSLDAVIEALGLMVPLVQAADPQLAVFMEQQGLPPFYALSWFITWFSHDVPDLAEAARLFDLFLSAHPLMPLYVGAAAMVSQRSALLAAEDMPHLHSALVNLAPTRVLSADELACQAIELFSRVPPAQLLSSCRVRLAVTPRAFLQGGVWEVPPQAAAASQMPTRWSRARLEGVMHALAQLPLPGVRHPKRRGLALTVSLTTGLLSVYLITLAMQLQAGLHPPWHGPPRG